MKINGFTLIELLVVISIIAILSSIAVVSYSGMTAKARDNQRIKDLQAIKQALELYRSDVHNYPVDDEDGFVLNRDTQLTGCTGITGACKIPSVYLQPIPKDSDATKYYRYSTLTISDEHCDNKKANSACLNFILCAKKEGADTTYDLSACGDFVCGSNSERCDIGISSQ